MNRYAKMPPPWDFLLSASRASLQSYELSRLSHAANVRKEIIQLLEVWLEETSAALMARWLMEQREELACTPVAPCSCDVRPKTSHTACPIISTQNRACRCREFAAPCETARATNAAEPSATFICTISVQPNRCPRGVLAPYPRKERATLGTKERTSAQHGCVPMTLTSRDTPAAKPASKQ